MDFSITKTEKTDSCSREMEGLVHATLRKPVSLESTWEDLLMAVPAVITTTVTITADYTEEVVEEESGELPKTGIRFTGGYHYPHITVVGVTGEDLLFTSLLLEHEDGGCLKQGFVDNIFLLSPV